jgi:hypothetical protein
VWTSENLHSHSHLIYQVLLAMASNVLTVVDDNRQQSEWCIEDWKTFFWVNWAQIGDCLPAFSRVVRGALLGGSKKM